MGIIFYMKSKKGKDNMQNENVIDFEMAKNKALKKISDSEINALFNGLVKIVKKSAIDDANEELKNECKVANENFRSTLIDLNKVERLLKSEQEKNEELNNKLFLQEKQICLLMQKLCNRKLKNLKSKSKENSDKLKSFLGKDKTLI